MKRTFVFICAVCCLVTSSCYYNVDEELNASGNCNTTAVTFSRTINTILANYGCFSCHSSGSPSGGVSLQTYTDVKINVNNNRLLGSITHASGFKPMPMGRSKMEVCDINKVKAWIDAGAPNN